MPPGHTTPQLGFSTVLTRMIECACGVAVLSQPDMCPRRKLLQQQLAAAGGQPGSVLIYSSPFSRTLQTAEAAAAAAGLDVSACMQVKDRAYAGVSQAPSSPLDMLLRCAVPHHSAVGEMLLPATSAGICIQGRHHFACLAASWAHHVTVTV
jgi:hypothetical protein